MTPETLAEINGHTEVIRVLRVWEHLKATDPTVASLAPSPCPPSDSAPTSPIDDDRRSFGHGSRKGKERALSFASNVSETTSGQAIRIKSSLEGLLKGRTSRSGSMASIRPEIRKLAPISTDDSAIDLSSPLDPSPLSATFEQERPEPQAAALERVSSTAASVGSSTAPVDPPAEDRHEPEDEATPTQSTDLGPAPSRHNPSTSGSSRRPSLPSIFEKAAHPGAAFRAALRRDHHRPPPLQTQLASNPAPSMHEPSPLSADSSARHSGHENGHGHSHGHGILRGRRRSNDSTTGKPKHVHKYMSKHALVSLFKRSHSPPSRSPSPPRRSDTSRPIIDAEQIEEGIEKMRRASLDLNLRDNASAEADETARPLPVSAPATRTSFFTEGIAAPIPPPNPAFIPLPSTPALESPPERANTMPSDRKGKSRQSSEVISPSPLAREWAGSSDSDTPPVGIRRSKTEYIRSSSSSQSSQQSVTRSARQSYRSTPPSPLRHPGGGRSRAVTSPSTPASVSSLRSASGTKLTGMGWNDVVDLRKVASLRRGSNLHLEREAREDEQDRGRGGESDGDEVFHDVEAESEETTPDGSEIHASAPTRPKESPDTGDKPNDATSGFAVTEPTLVEIGDPPKSQANRKGRYRGASVGSMSFTTESLRLSTPPGSTTRLSLLPSDDEPRLPTYVYPPYGNNDAKLMPPPSVPSDGGRARGKSVSSVSSIPSDLSVSYFLPSTPGTSLTPQSTLSMPLGRFPPVPENEVAHHPAPRRKVSNRQEAKEAKKQAEEDVLQLAQLPPSLDSSRSLAAQLAAYGESVEVEEKFAAREKRAKGSTSGVSGEDETEGSESESYFSARSDAEDSRGSSGHHSTVSRNKQGRAGSYNPLAKPFQRSSPAVPSLSGVTADLLPVNAPKDSLTSINSIYDKRAAAYRDRMAALTALPPTFSPALSSPAPRGARPRAGSNDSWLTAGPSQRRPSTLLEPEMDRYPNTSTPQPVKSNDSALRNHRKPGSAGQLAGSMRSSTYVSSKVAPSIASTPSMTRSSVSTRSRAPAPAPIADVISTRYAGMSPPPNVPQPPRLDSNSPYISIFSHRYSGHPLDGDDSDDEEQQPQALTVIENDWRGGKVLGGDDLLERKGRWGQLKGAIGHLGHRRS
jgi:hypothetical protein